jgi:phosphate transport system protein
MATAVRHAFAKRLQNLEEEVLRLGNAARHAVDDAVFALTEGDVERARGVIARDSEINAARFGIEKQCYAMIATEQPVAVDLRAIVAALMICVDLERIGDHAKKVAQIALRLAETPRPIYLDNIPRMGSASLSMLDRALEARVTRDLMMAQAVCAADDEVDSMYKEIFDTLIMHMLKTPSVFGVDTYLIQVAHEFERVGDRATNVAERVIYTVTGELTDLNV